MYYTLEELVDQYIARKVLVSIKELEEEGLLQEFCDRVEELSPTSKGHNLKTHRELYDYNINLGFKLDDFYFKMHTYDNENLTYGILTQHAPEHKIAHLISDIPPIDMESLLNE